MIQRSEAGEPTLLSAHGFILDVVIDQHAPSTEDLACKIADALFHVEGCGNVNVGYLGEMPLDEDGSGTLFGACK